MTNRTSPSIRVSTVSREIKKNLSLIFIQHCVSGVYHRRFPVALGISGHHQFLFSGQDDIVNSHFWLLNFSLVSARLLGQDIILLAPYSPQLSYLVEDPSSTGDFGRCVAQRCNPLSLYSSILVCHQRNSSKPNIHKPYAIE